jgi:hypothetical protein
MGCVFLLEHFHETGLASRFNHDRSPVAQHFRHALHYFRRVVTHADDCIPAHLFRVRNHQFERVLARLFAQLLQQSDVSADDGLQARSNRSKDGSRSHHDPARHPYITGNAIAVQRESSGCHVGSHCEIISLDEARLGKIVSYGVSAFHPVTYGIAIGVMALVAMAASWFPVWRAISVANTTSELEA